MKYLTNVFLLIFYVKNKGVTILGEKQWFRKDIRRYILLFDLDDTLLKILKSRTYSI